MIFTAYTLVDITDSGVRRPPRSTAFNQQQNNNTLVQLISLRAQPADITTTKLTDQDLSTYNFGTHFASQSSATVWMLTFTTDVVDAWKERTNDKYHLESDCHSVAIITGLKETVKIKPSLFDTTSNKCKNLYFTTSNE